MFKSMIFTNSDPVSESKSALAPVNPDLSNNNALNTRGLEMPVLTRSIADGSQKSALLVAKKATSKGPNSRRKKKGKAERLFNMTGMPPSYLLSKSLDNKPYDIVQSYYSLNFHSTSTTVETFNNIVSQASAVDQWTSLIVVFDQFRIVEVEHFLMPHTSAITSNTASPGISVSVVDYDDNTNLSTVASALDYQNALVGDAITGHHRIYKPHCAVAAYQGAFTAYANEESPWLDAAYGNTYHYGCKFAFGITDVVYKFDVLTRLHLQLRNVR